MDVGVVGVSYKTAELPLRERVAANCERVDDGFVVLSTCNRIEIYFPLSSLNRVFELINLDKNFIYSHFGFDCFSHLVRVASGLDSVVLGETEIKRQVKESYSLVKRLPSELHFLFQKALKISKQVRSCLDNHQFNITDVVLNFVGNNYKKKRFLFVGNSSINRQIMQKCLDYGITNLYLCSKHSKTLLPWDEINNWYNYDILIFGSKNKFVFSLDKLDKNVINKQIFIDLGVPRNVDPLVGENVPLFNIDQINKMILSNSLLNNVSFCKSEEIVQNEVKKQIEIFHNKSPHPNSGRWVLKNG